MRWKLNLGDLTNAQSLEFTLRRAAAGPTDDKWIPPAWLLAHQVDAARRVKSIIDALGGALLCDAVGLGKTYVALATTLA